jgi:hypothetical protein
MLGSPEELAREFEPTAPSLRRDPAPQGLDASLKGDPEGAERNFLASLDWARRQQAKMWELRTSTSLARLWQSLGKRQEAYELLAPVYGRFTEGFDTKGLQEAKALLAELG